MSISKGDSTQTSVQLGMRETRGPLHYQVNATQGKSWKIGMGSGVLRTLNRDWEQLQGIWPPTLEKKPAGRGGVLSGSRRCPPYEKTPAQSPKEGRTDVKTYCWSRDLMQKACKFTVDSVVSSGKCTYSVFWQIIDIHRFLSSDV